MCHHKYFLFHLQMKGGSQLFLNPRTEQLPQVKYWYACMHVCMCFFFVDGSSYRQHHRLLTTSAENGKPTVMRGSEHPSVHISQLDNFRNPRFFFHFSLTCGFVLINLFFLLLGLLCTGVRVLCMTAMQKTL